MALHGMKRINFRTLNAVECMKNTLALFHKMLDSASDQMRPEIEKVMIDLNKAIQRLEEGGHD